MPAIGVRHRDGEPSRRLPIFGVLKNNAPEVGTFRARILPISRGLSNILPEIGTFRARILPISGVLKNNLPEIGRTAFQRPAATRIVLPPRPPPLTEAHRER
jgi:hypothetical protein